MTPSKPIIRFGIIGCGNIAYWTHFREIQKVAGARLVAASDPDATARARAAQLAGVPVYADADELLAQADVDAVIICVPSGLHAALAIKAASAGKHFYLEKPIAISMEESRQVMAAASASGVTATTGFNRRFNPAFVMARALIQAGRIGAIRAVHTVFCEPSTLEELPLWKRTRESGGGVLLDLASHHIDQIRWTLDEEVVDAQATTASVASEQDSASLQLTMESGVGVTGYFSFRAGRTDTLEFIGELGILRVDRFTCMPTLQVSRRFGYGVRTACLAPNGAILRWKLARYKSPSWEPSYRNSLQAFTHACLGRPTTMATLLDGQKSLEVVLAAEAAAQPGRDF